ncbi:MAG: tyrosine--tRNA ligase [Candidatus Portnoybacteria bacterium CG10_big_fil_rev_8_21_14_0_10_44_7]|uniref:Tyrosine--tRNA ligase n=1 Tax=Candidatus Portnoybacteria bacterium CG10_big_fil_rev_8_21_14_0_10_44_7 TaxID=1974816 RepID=A0A2M8KJ41_9BACT|nr:MAG: tyrosine--tRNA ligase [Candidatus Portnoybacteria bacterium CG10_big_fil_rev_8_21_14_0_10_44_7]
MSKVIVDEKKIEEILTRGVEDVIDREHLKKRLLAGEKLRVKLGIDPTGPRLHLGRAIALWKLRDLQDLGHQIVLIIGDFTGQLGDASDKDSQRPMKEKEELEKNAREYKKQLNLILDVDKAEVCHNSEWLGKLNFGDVVSLAALFTVRQMLNRRNFRERDEKKQEIGLHEFLYPLMQGYDSVAIEADVETGGSDQLFNLKAGREIQRHFGQAPQDIMTYEMLYGLDGRKMSTSWGNVITLLDDPQDKFGKIMSMKDQQIIDYFRLATRLPLSEIKEIEKALSADNMNPRDAKMRLAFELVKLYHGADEAQKAETEFKKVFQQGQKPSEMERVKIRAISLDSLVQIKAAKSKGEARRLMEQGAVKINDQKKTDWQKGVEVKRGDVIQVGPRKFFEVK